jgi:periplasmic protein TonB
MFEDALMESSNGIKTKSKYWSILTLIINCGVLIALMIWPLLHPEALPAQIMATLLVAPPPPLPPPQAPQPKMQVRSEMLDHGLQSPSKIPKGIRLAKEPVAPLPTIGVLGMEGMADGIRGDAMNAIFNGIGVGHAFAGRVVAAQKLSISSGVMAGNLLDKVTPQYPAIAKAARIQGVVVLQATISIVGTIQNLRVISGPPMLQQAALDAVRSWRYKPYLLNGEPVEVETTVNVVFNLGG